MISTAAVQRAARQSKSLTWFNQYRNRRPTLRIGKEKFQLSVDLRQFNKNEIRVKSNPQYLLIEGKREKLNKDGEIYVIRQFVRKFKLPEGTVVDRITSILSSEGMLTISAPRELDDEDSYYDMEVPVTFAEHETVSKDIPVAKLEEKDSR